MGRPSRLDDLAVSGRGGEVSSRLSAVERVSYEAPGWGVGELWLQDDVLLWHESPRAGTVHTPSQHPLAQRLERYFAGDPVSFDDVTLALEELPPFHRELAKALRQVPRATVVSYGELAALAGRPRAARAAGTFCASNRFGIILPCHRVVSATGLGSFGSLGLDYKLRLLALEGWQPA